jgi:MYXO-CTERM domain-containing protein
MKRITIAIGLLLIGLSSSAHAAIPAGYNGRPFDPAVAGGTFNGMPTSAITTAGPYPIPGRLEFENYDMGGLNVGYFTTDHIGCAGGAYRMDGQTASLCATSPMADTTYGAPNGDVFYDTGTPLDGTTYPNATTADVYIGAVRPGDWVNITVNVMTAGTFVVSSTWASGNGNPGKEGGDGAMELQVSVNGTMMLDWKDTFPNYNTTANFHNWKTYSNMGTVTLQAGLQVIKLLSVDPHLNLDYVQFTLPGADGGTGTDAATSTDGGTTGTGGAGGAAAATGTAGANGTSGANGAGGVNGVAGANGTGGTPGGTSGAAGTGGTGSSNPGTGGSVGGSGAAGVVGSAGGSGLPAMRASSNGCSYVTSTGAPGKTDTLTIGGVIALVGSLARRRRGRRRAEVPTKRPFGQGRTA